MKELTALMFECMNEFDIFEVFCDKRCCKVFLELVAGFCIV